MYLLVYFIKLFECKFWLIIMVRCFFVNICKKEILKRLREKVLFKMWRCIIMNKIMYYLFVIKLNVKI